MSFLKILFPKKNKKTRLVNDNSFYFHEDDYCQAEILPASNFDFCVDELKAIHTFSEKHRDGIGFTDMYIRKDVSKSIGDLYISVSRFEELVLPVLDKFDSVKTGYSSFVENCKNTIAYGNDKCAILVCFSENIIRNVWMAGTITSDKQVIDFQTALNNIGIAFDLILVDWNGLWVTSLKNKEGIEEYLKTIKI